MCIDFEHHPFWDYSISVYSQEGVSPALIAMQDRHGLDVNILLLCLWVGHSGRGVLNEAEFDHVLAVSASWNPEIVCGLRALRIRLRDGVPHVARDLSDAVRKRILETEIDCEHVEQLALAAGLSATEERSRSVEQRFDDCLANFAGYFRRHGYSPAAEDAECLKTVLSAAFPDIAADRIEAGWARSLMAAGGA